jgi:hypothetical protein
VTPDNWRNIAITLKTLNERQPVLTRVIFRNPSISATLFSDMSVRFKNTSAFVVGAAALLLAVCTILWLLWVRDVRDDRKHTLIVNTTTPVFIGKGDVGGCHGTQLTTIERGAKLPVRR